MQTQKRIPDFGNPDTVVRFAPMSGAFGTNEYLGKPEAFVDRVIGTWYNVRGNTLTVEPDQHREAAKQLFPLYEKLRQNRQRLSQAQAGLVLGTLNKTGSVTKGMQVLEAALTQHE